MCSWLPRLVAWTEVLCTSTPIRDSLLHVWKVHPRRNESIPIVGNRIWLKYEFLQIWWALSLTGSVCSPRCLAEMASSMQQRLNLIDASSTNVSSAASSRMTWEAILDNISYTYCANYLELMAAVTQERHNLQQQRRRNCRAEKEVYSNFLPVFYVIIFQYFIFGHFCS